MNKKMALSIVGTFVIGIAGGVGLMMNDSAYSSVKVALGGQATQNAIGSVNAQGMVTAQFSNMDLETALMQVQSQRANVLEEQLKGQMETIQARNNEIAKLNEIISKLKASRPAKPEASVTLDADLHKKLTENGIKVPSSNKWSQADVDVALESLRGKIDSLNSSQQMDMLRMQSLTNKRNEAFDLMTNFIKKMADQRSSVIGNMR
ncbi:hypothetical protein ACFQ88_09090 [Paenibacillus sp. NPDC056579]|uniref:hypothetical protein n=1 Tax=unclassified Paenibacillus TaxID=185978 RepID=UPI001EF933A5|nr:hypothetical protein [Paenibacillus sp. H1-7]ULL14428.1 hypothetical protein DVH26_08175 [Paenibacillus sp. H1-7]